MAAAKKAASGSASSVVHSQLPSLLEDLEPFRRDVGLHLVAGVVREMRQLHLQTPPRNCATQRFRRCIRPLLAPTALVRTVEAEGQADGVLTGFEPGLSGSMSANSAER